MEGKRKKRDLKANHFPAVENNMVATSTWLINSKSIPSDSMKTMTDDNYNIRRQGKVTSTAKIFNEPRIGFGKNARA
jgi:hypothetical protein